MKRLALPLLIVGLALGGVSGCSSVIDVRGNVPAPERLAEIKPGKVGRADVIALLGTPSARSTFGEDQWYYISSKIESYAFYQPVEIERQVVIVTFERSGVVKGVDNLTLKDGKIVSPVDRETPTAGQDLTVLGQLLGNVGRFNGAGKGGAGGGGGGGGR